MENLVCPICNKAFKVKKSHLKKRRYCSRLCMAKAYKENLLSANNPHWRGGKIKKICLRCGKEYFAIKAKEKTSKYCSQKCFREVRVRKIYQQRVKIKKIRKENFCLYCHKKIKLRNKFCSMDCLKKFNRISNPYKITLRCPVCLTEFKTYKNRIKKFCSRKCYHKIFGYLQTGEKSHFWKNGATQGKIRIRVHPLYKKWRKAIFERDNYTCQSCLKTSSELTRGKLCAHHIVKFSDDPKLALKVSNGITLCWQCHRDFHKFVRNGILAKKESALKEQAKEFFEGEPGVFFFKVFGNAFQESGLPDFIGVVAGRACGIELKIFPNFVSPLQKYQLKRMERSGAAIFVCYSIDEVKRAIYSIKESQENT